MFNPDGAARSVKPVTSPAVSAAPRPEPAPPAATLSFDPAPPPAPSTEAAPSPVAPIAAAAPVEPVSAPPPLAPPPAEPVLPPANPPAAAAPPAEPVHPVAPSPAAITSEAESAIDEGEMLLRRAIEMVRGPRRAVSASKGLTDSKPASPAALAGAMQAKKPLTGRMVRIQRDLAEVVVRGDGHGDRPVGPAAPGQRAPARDVRSDRLAGDRRLMRRRARPEKTTGKSWSEWQDLNLRPPRPERGLAAASHWKTSDIRRVR